MTDKFQNHLTGLRDPIETAVEVVPSDSDDLEAVSRALFIGTAGMVRVTMRNGATVNFKLGQGWHPIRVSKVWQTGTTATDIVTCS